MEKTKVSKLKEIENSVKESMKAGDKARTTALRGLVNVVKLVAKNDGNREPTDDDVITAGNRVVKQIRETLSFIPETAEDQRAPLLAEIATVEAFLPQKMDRTKLAGLIEELLKDAPEGKAAKGFVMKNLNQTYRGMFDASMANEIVAEKVG